MASLDAEAEATRAGKGASLTARQQLAQPPSRRIAALDLDPRTILTRQAPIGTVQKLRLPFNFVLACDTPGDRERRHHESVGDSTLADAILDRVIHNAHRLQLSGDSLRKQKALQTVPA